MTPHGGGTALLTPGGWHNNWFSTFTRQASRLAAIVTWERGAGATLSCGTGASASAAVARRRGVVGDAVTVLVPGGELVASFTADGTVVLAGPVVHVATVEPGPGLAGAVARRSRPSASSADVPAAAGARASSGGGGVSVLPAGVAASPGGGGAS